MVAAAVRLTGRPVIWDIEDAALDDPPIREPATPRVRKRADRLRRGLQSMGVRSGQRVVVLCCADHTEDRSAAQAALEALGAIPLVPGDWTKAALAELFSRQSAPNLHLACAEGVAAWRTARGTGIMIGDGGGDGVLWWKALECRHSRTTSGPV
jgi:hypothetical protein